MLTSGRLKGNRRSEALLAALLMIGIGHFQAKAGLAAEQALARALGAQYGLPSLHRDLVADDGMEILAVVAWLARLHTADLVRGA